MHVCYLQHLSELVEFFHKAHAGQDVLLSYPRVLRDDIWFFSHSFCGVLPVIGHLKLAISFDMLQRGI